MRLERKNMCLYAVTDRSWVGERSFLEQIEDSLKGGITLLQLREKNLSKDAKRAEEMGADYLGVGAMFATSTKTEAEVITKERLMSICQSVSIPVVAIGGIKEENMEALKGSGISGVAVISGIYAQKDIESACRRLLKLSKEITK